MPVKNEREYRSMMDVSAASGNDGEYIVEGYATTFDDPYALYEFDGVSYSERIARSALEGADVSDVIMQYDHAGRVYARQSNGTLQITPDDHGIKIRADLSSTEGSRALYDDIKVGLITRMSWAFTVAEDAYDRDTHTRTIQRIKKVYDVSAVSIPANPNTEIAARDYFSAKIEAEKLQRARQIKKIKLLMEME